MPSYLLDDGYPDDWFVPPSAAAPSATPPAFSAQPTSNNPSSDDALSGPFNPLSPAWDSLPADRLYKVAWAPPIFPDA